MRGSEIKIQGETVEDWLCRAKIVAGLKMVADLKMVAELKWLQG